MPKERSHVKVTRAAGAHVVQFQDRKILEELCIWQIGEELSSLVDSQPAIKLLLNFVNVDHLSSAALGMLVTLSKQISQTNGRLKLSDINPQIFEVFKITRLDRIFEIHPTAAEALASF